MLPLQLIHKPYLYAGIAVILLATHGYAYFTGKGHGMERYYQFKANVEEQQEITKQDHKRKLKEAQDATKLTNEGYSHAVAYWRKHGGPVRVLPTNCDQGTGTKAPGTFQGLDATARVGLTGSFEDAPTVVTADRCEELINKGIKGAAQTLWLQNYVEGLCAAYGCE